MEGIEVTGRERSAMSDENLAQLEKTVRDINRIDEWARKIWGSVCLLGPEDQDRLAQIIDACEKWRQPPNSSAQQQP